MKNIIKTAILLFTIISCKAQSTIYNLNNNDYSTEAGAYNKDVNNLLDPFQGTYLYTDPSTNTSLEIQLIKKEMQCNSKYCEDLMIGEYEYKVNNVVQVSTLANINVNYPNRQFFEHAIAGNTFKKKTSRPPCNDCGVNEKRLLLGFTDPTTPNYGEILIRKITQNGVPAIKVFIRGTGGPSYNSSLGQQPPLQMKVPAGEYILIKQ